MPKRHGFTCEAGELRELAQAVLERARRAGASGCDCDVSEGYGLSVTVRKGKPDTVEHNRDRSIGVTVYFGERPRARRGHASTSDFSRAALEQTVDAAVAIARHTAEDDCAGLPERRAARARHARPRPVPPLDHLHRGGGRAREALRGRGVRRVEEDPQLRGRHGLGAADAVRVRQQPRLHRRLSRLAPLPVLRGDRRGQGADAARRLVQRLARAGAASPTRARSAATPASAPRRAWARARSPPARRRCCSRRRWRSA